MGVALALAALVLAATAALVGRRVLRPRQDVHALAAPPGITVASAAEAPQYVEVRCDGPPPRVSAQARAESRVHGSGFVTGDPGCDTDVLLSGSTRLLVAWLTPEVREELRWLVRHGATIHSGVGRLPRYYRARHQPAVVLQRLAVALEQLSVASTDPITALDREDTSEVMNRSRLEILMKMAPESPAAARAVRWALLAGQAGFDDTIRRRVATHQLSVLVEVAADATLSTSVRAGALRAIRGGDHPPEALAALEHGLQSDEESIRRTAAERLGLAKGAAVGEALRLLEIAIHDSRAAVRRATMTALGRLGDEPGVEDKAVAALASGLEDSAASVSRAAAAALAHLRSDAGIDALVRLLGAATGRSLKVYARSLAQIGSPRAEGQLVDAARRLTGDDQLVVVSALGEFGGRDSVQPLLDLGAGWFGSTLKDATLSAVAKIQGRLTAAPVGALAVMAPDEAEGGLSIGPEEGGLSVEFD